MTKPQREVIRDLAQDTAVDTTNAELLILLSRWFTPALCDDPVDRHHANTRIAGAIERVIHPVGGAIEDSLARHFGKRWFNSVFEWNL